ncbi:MAG: signal peptidase I [Parcubacteria group bacterium]|nr:signal peptidase I [Parcubacteria group bacterium]
MLPEELQKNETQEGSIKSFVLEIAKFVFLALIIVVPIRVYVAQPYIVSGTSMVPTFENGDYLIVDQLSYRFHEPERGDVIVFRYPKDPSKFFIKRIIALPQETISIERGVVTIKNSVSREEFVLEESYNTAVFSDTTTVALQEKEYFVMGDNRGASLDSRSWGALPRELVVGRALVRLFPFNHISVFPGLASYVQ